MGHFGPNGCQLVVEEVIRRARSSPRAVDLLELGSGYGGALRDIALRLNEAGLRRGRTVGVELVGRLCSSAVEINRALGARSISFLRGDARDLPVTEESFDFVVLTGSMPHMADAPLVLGQALRCLRPGGWLLFTEEVSLVRDPATLGEEFLANHPRPVFHFHTLADRRGQVTAAGFELLEARVLSAWAFELLSDRKKAFHLLRGTLEGVYGSAGWRRLERALDACLEELERGSLTPAFFAARRPAPR